MFPVRTQDACYCSLENANTNLDREFCLFKCLHTFHTFPIDSNQPEVYLWGSVVLKCYISISFMGERTSSYFLKEFMPHGEENSNNGCNTLICSVCFLFTGVSVCRRGLYRQWHKHPPLQTHRLGFPHRLSVCHTFTWAPGTWQLRLHRYKEQLLMS